MEKLICFFLNVGDVVDIQLSGGKAKRYQVVETNIVPMGEARSGFTHNQERLTLVTKFPFDAQDAKQDALCRRRSSDIGLGWVHTSPSARQGIIGLTGPEYLFFWTSCFFQKKE